jgi:hypothetical protein
MLVVMPYPNRKPLGMIVGGEHKGPFFKQGVQGAAALLLGGAGANAPRIRAS